MKNTLNKKNLFGQGLFLIFLILYIIVEFGFREYSINLLGSNHLLPYQINSFEKIGRGITSFGFAIFFINIGFIKNLSKKKKTVTFITIFLISFVFLKLFIDNIDKMVDQKTKENAYYASLFRDGVKYMPNIFKHYPIADIDEKSFEYKVFQTNSSFLYLNNDNITQHVDQFEENYIQSIVNNYLDDDEMKSVSTWIRNPVFQAHDRFEDLFEKLDYSSPEHRSFRDTVYKPIIFETVVYFYLHYNNIKVKDRYLQNRREQINLSEEGKTYARKVVRNRGRMTESTFREAIKIWSRDMGAEIIYALKNNYYTYNSKLNTFFKNNGIEEINYPFRNPSYEESYDLFNHLTSHLLTDYFDVFFSAAFEGITNNDIERLKHEFKANHVYGDTFVKSAVFREMMAKYDHYFINDVNLFARTLKPDLIKVNRRGVYMEGGLVIAGMRFFTSYNETEFIDSVSEKLKEIMKREIELSKGDYHLHVKNVIIPPLVLFLANIALFLNISLFLFKILNIFIDFKKYNHIVMLFIFINLFLFAGIKDENKSTHDFYDNYAINSMKIPKSRLVAMEWLINKNRFIEQLVFWDNNYFFFLAKLVENYEIEKSKRDGTDFLSIAHDNRD